MSLTRRRFCSYGAGALVYPVVGSTLTACDQTNAGGFSDEKQQLLSSMQRYLMAELEDESLANELAGMIYDSCFISQPESCSISSVNTILALAFGNRPTTVIPKPGEAEPLAEPGPTNEKLADSVYELYSQQPVPIYAQWEIARFLESKYQLTDIVSIEPVFTAEGKIEYLSTLGVVQQAVSTAGGADNLGICAVIGHHDHIRRCVMTAKLCGVNAFKAQDIVLPADYDLESGQAWTRSRDLYVPVDLVNRMQMNAQLKITKKYPNG
ncbi:hypothetical protein [Serratia sp. UGAL515B_01]|uniref:hypothetical protein n=1 Tax=Serratia sp. UGAL515B_01 TaxID=2986763 RepID=UPI002952A4A9|nr:hypothetical protein [Serratia sp. UGAL515B_01]WON76443.1 hypothetical protein OK023_14635 [Serratia sp. UGAL515B_01]